jgi:hypothetical protein
MPPEEQEAMPTPELHAADKNTTVASTGACSYPLETLMALQKMLEYGIPEHASNPTPRSAPPSIVNTPETRQSSVDLYGKISSAIENWVDSIHAFLTRRKKPNSRHGKGNSAQQTG